MAPQCDFCMDNERNRAKWKKPVSEFDVTYMGQTVDFMVCLDHLNSVRLGSMLSVAREKVIEKEAVLGIRKRRGIVVGNPLVDIPGYPSKK